MFVGGLDGLDGACAYDTIRAMPTTFTTVNGDISWGVLDGLDSLRQRVLEAYRFRLGEWFLDIREGNPAYQELLGIQHVQGLAERVFVSVAETFDEITAVLGVQANFDRRVRQLTSELAVATIYGPTVISVRI